MLLHKDTWIQILSESKELAVRYGNLYLISTENGKPSRLYYKKLKLLKAIHFFYKFLNIIHIII